MPRLKNQPAGTKRPRSAKILRISRPVYRDCEDHCRRESNKRYQDAQRIGKEQTGQFLLTTARAECYGGLRACLSPTGLVQGARIGYIGGGKLPGLSPCTNHGGRFVASEITGKLGIKKMGSIR